MRDLRRYSVPVTINNPKQVNIAADGGQQVNLQKQSKKRKETGSASKSKRSSKRTTKAKPKQLDPKSPGESVRMKPTSESVQLD